MSTTEDDSEQFMDDTIGLLPLPGNPAGTRSRPKAERIFDGLVKQWGMPITRVGPDAVEGANISLVRQQFSDPDWRDQETWAEREYGAKRPFLAGAARAVDVEDGEDGPVTRAFESMEERATITATNPILKTASPVEVDPQIVQVLRSKAPLPQRVVTQAQAGFSADYNIVNSRSAPSPGMVSESGAVDLSGDTPSDFGLSNEQKDMTIFVDLVEISDFSQRAEQTLDYMDLTQTTLGQRMIEAALFKNKQFYYGDPSVAATDGSVEDSDAYDGMVVLANNASTSYVIDKSATSSGFLEDIKSELTTVVQNTGLTYDSAAIAVSPTMFDALENEANAVVRLDGYDESLNFGGRAIQIKGVEVFEDPNIRNYTGLSSTTTAGGDEGDVFVFDSRNLQFRQLAPLSTVPLGRIGLADRAALFEYGRLISKSQGEHLRVLQAYDV